MMRFGSGRIINIASVWGVVGSAVESTYSGAKAGVIGFRARLAKNLAAQILQLIVSARVPLKQR